MQFFAAHVITDPISGFGSHMGLSLIALVSSAGASIALFLIGMAGLYWWDVTHGGRRSLSPQQDLAIELFALAALTGDFDAAETAARHVLEKRNRNLGDESGMA